MTLELGTYCQIYEPNDPTNTQHTRSTAAIALTPTGKEQGGYWFMSLVTGARLSRKQWDVLLMPQGVIARVEQMGLDQNQPLMIGGMPVFEWAPGIAIIDDVNDNIDLDIEEDDLPDDKTHNENEEDDLPDDEDIPPFDPFVDDNTNDIVHDDKDAEAETEYENHTDDKGDEVLHISTDDSAANSPDNGIFVEDVGSAADDPNNGIFVEDVDDDDEYEGDNNVSAEICTDAEELFPTVPPDTPDTTTEQRSDDDSTDSTLVGPAFNTRPRDPFLLTHVCTQYG